MKTNLAAELVLDQYLAWEKEFCSNDAYTFTLGFVAGMVGGGGLTFTQYATLSKGTGRLSPEQFKEHLKGIINGTIF